MNLTDLDSLVTALQDPDLRAAMAHPDWEAAYEALVSVQSDRIEGFSDLSDSAQFMSILDCQEFSVENGFVMSNEYAWRDGAWDYGSEA